MEDFVEKFQRLKVIKDESLVVLLDFDGALANKAATALANAQVPQERILFIRGGFEGSQGWLVSTCWRSFSSRLHSAAAVAHMVVQSW